MSNVVLVGSSVFLHSSAECHVGFASRRAPILRLSKRKSGFKSCCVMSLPGYGHESMPQGYGYSQNEDYPSVLPKRKKKPYVRHINLLKRENRRRKRLQIPRKMWKAPSNGMLVESQIPVAHKVMRELSVLREGVKKLMEVIPVQACSFCDEIHVGAKGHLIRSCQGSGCRERRGLHAWGDAFFPDVLTPITAYHVPDRLQRPLGHEQRFRFPRLCAITEVCIQAGYEHPDYPVIRWARFSGRQVGDGRAPVPETKLLKPFTEFPEEQREDEQERFLQGFLGEGRDAPLQMPQSGSCIVFDAEKDKLVATAERTLAAFHGVRKGVQKLMKTYVVKACGYCPEVYIGRRGHRARVCRTYKHNYRGGQHGWQEAGLSDVFPPRFVWHVPDGQSPELKRELRRFYGQAPAVVELCVQAGARVPPKWKPFMRLDVAIPDLSLEESEAAC